MADDKTTDKAPASEKKFPARRLVEEAHAFFGVAAHVVAGALHGIEQEAELTVAEASRLIEAFKNRKVN